ncbi:MAG TPA: CAP domain-containing protein [Candidatus Paceibacterota bacterium]|jgi:uncharacterized protein YkwD|nr:CAP domain-containing protein [Candidatus Paceibacterota bacterium]
MLKRIIITCLVAGAVTVGTVLLWPLQTRAIAARVMQNIFHTNQLTTTIGQKEASTFKALESTDLPKETRNSLLAFLGIEPTLGDFTAEDVIDATNTERLKAGLTPFRVNDKLNASAKLKVEDMIAKQYFEHTSPSGVTVSDLGKKAGYNYIILGENLALGDFTDANDLLAAWMASPGHRANILNPLYRDIGVSVEKGMFNGQEVWFAVQHFGTTRNACPTIDQTLKTTIDQSNTDLANRQTILAQLKSKIDIAEAANEPDEDVQILIDRFNDEIRAYNNLLAQVQMEITEYNKEVSDFNACLARYQKSGSAVHE